MPAPTPFTSADAPLTAVTVAAASLVVVHVTTREYWTRPAVSLLTAVSNSVPPTAIRVDSGVTVTDPIGGSPAFTKTVISPTTPSTSALINADPSARADPSPVADTLATAGVLLL